MATEIEPVVDHWYETIFGDRRLKVVCVDEERRLIEVQYDDGHLEDYCLQTWFELDLDRVAAPPEWSDNNPPAIATAAGEETLPNWDDEF